MSYLRCLLAVATNMSLILNYTFQLSMTNVAPLLLRGSERLFRSHPGVDTQAGKDFF